MYKIKRTNSDDLNFQKLIVELDKDLAITDGDEHAFYNQFNKIAAIKHVIVVYEDDVAIGCGAIKEYEKQVTEVKRMFVQPNKRGKGIATLVLKELEAWAKELGYHKCILENGTKKPQAIALYKNNNFIITDNYGQYTEVENSICFEKKI